MYIMAFTDHTGVVTTDAWYDAVLPRSLKSTPAGEQRARLKRIEKRAAKAQERAEQEQRKYDKLVEGKYIPGQKPVTVINLTEPDERYDKGLASLKRYEPPPPAKQKKKKPGSTELTKEQQNELQNDLFYDPFAKSDSEIQLEKEVQDCEQKTKELKRQFRDAVKYTEEVREKWEKIVADKDAKIAKLKEGMGAKLLKYSGLGADFADNVDHLA